MEHKETFSDMMLNLVLNMMGFGLLGGLGLVGIRCIGISALENGIRSQS